MSRPITLLAAMVALLGAAACDKVPLLAPTQSTITLTVNTTTLPVNGTATVVASVTEQAGTPAQNGTVVTFTASFGTVEPAEARTEGGKATVTFRAGSQSGLAKIGAFSGATRATEVEVRVGGAAAERVSLRAEPATVPQSGGTVQLIAIITDASGNALPGAPLVFSADNGVLANNTGVSDGNGEVRTSLTTNRETVVRANVAGKEGQVTVRAVNLPTVTMSVTGTPTVGVPVGFTITPSVPTGGSPIQNVQIDFGDNTGLTNLGGITGATGVSHVYSSAGTYTVTATVIDATGQRSTSSLVITLQRNPPTVSVTSSAAGGTTAAGSTVSFTITASPASGGPALREVRATVNGTLVYTSTGGGTFARQFNAPGTYTIVAEATDQAGSTATASTTLIVTAAAAVDVTLDASSAEGNVPLSCVPATGYPKTCNINFVGMGVRIQFAATVSGATPTGYFWSFGDGTSESTSNRQVDHVFTGRGTFTITVTAQTTVGTSGTQRLTLIVQ